MKRHLTICAVVGVLGVTLSPAAASADPAPALTIDGKTFRDLDRNGLLEPYEDWRLSPQARAADLVKRMTLEEKAALMMHGNAMQEGGFPPPPGAPYDLRVMQPMIDQGVGAVVIRAAGDAASLAAQNNRLQEAAARTRLGIPLTISTDPRNHFQSVVGASVQSSALSQWPETLGLAALRDPSLTRRFADIARQEYRAVGINMALSPMADLATEPRWPRIYGTFGEDADVVRAHVQAYVEGFQGGADGVTAQGVATVVKHFAGYGAEKDGWDGHNYYGRFTAFPGGRFDDHLRAFEGALTAKTAGVMPAYTIAEGVAIDGQPLEPVAAGFSRQLLTGVLRGRYGYDGVIVSDWMITDDCDASCREGSPAGQPPALPINRGMPWGMEAATKADRFVKAVEAGVDQFGGVFEPQVLVAAVRDGRLTEARIDASAQRLLVQKFELGLFERPFVDPEAAAAIVGASAFQAVADKAQKESTVLLENRNALLPLKPGAKLYVSGMDPAAVRAAGFTVVDAPEQADVAVVRTSTPHQVLHPGYFFASMMNEGDLDFKPDSEAFKAISGAAAEVPTVVVVHLDRPAILTNVRDKAGAILGVFGISDANLLAVLKGDTAPRGKLPFELPSSMDEVRAQRPDTPHDTAHPLYPYGYGLSYGAH